MALPSQGPQSPSFHAMWPQPTKALYPGSHPQDTDLPSQPWPPELAKFAPYNPSAQGSGSFVPEAGLLCERQWEHPVQALLALSQRASGDWRAVSR